MSIQHFVSHLDEIVAYTGDGSYVAKRLVAYPIGASGWVHATLLTMPPGTKVLSHWHDDREAVFYCVAGRGTFALDDVVVEAEPGTAMLQTRTAVHGFQASRDGEFHFLDFALLTDTGSHRPAPGCFVRRDELPADSTAFGSQTALFAPSRFSNHAVRFVGERAIEGTFDASHVEDGTEQILLVLDGTGRLELLGETVELREGSVAYLIAGVPFRIDGSLRTVGASSLPGRLPEPPLFEHLRHRYGTE